MTELSEELKKNLEKVVDVFDKEDEEARERQLLLWRKLKLIWEGFSRIYYSEVAHDWRIYDASETNEQSLDQSYYDKNINVFKAYLESIIAALSITVPTVKCYPEDADNSNDLSTAKTADKIAEIIYRHNDVALLWLHALFIMCTEGLVACYTYTKADKSYGEYTIPNKKIESEYAKACPTCGIRLPEDIFGPPTSEEFQPESNISPISCPECKSELPEDIQPQEFTIERILDNKSHPKSRVCIEAYGGLYVKVPNYAMKQEDIPYLMFTYETHYSNVLDRYPNLRKDLINSSGALTSGSKDAWSTWARTNPQYYNDIPRDNVTVRNVWLRPSAYNVLGDEQHVNEIRKKFPDGCKVVMINELFAEATNEKLDDYWTLTRNPLSDYLHHEPLGASLTGVQDITQDFISLILQTIEHGIPQTFADPSVLNFQNYKSLETTPGSVFPAKPKSGQRVGDSFYEIKTATLSQEVLPFLNRIQEFGQMVSGALPSLFGGQLEGSKTASEYSMSRSQALQRLQNTWKMLTIWWKNIYGKAIPMYIKIVEEQGDERNVERDINGNFVNVFIRRSELQGKIGRIELEASENLPLTWQQKKDAIMQLIEMNNPEILATLASPENLPFLKEAIGLTDFIVPGTDDRQKQYEEIQQLIISGPIMVPMDPNMAEVDPMLAQAMGPTEIPSVEIDPLIDNHNIHAEICRIYLISDAGRLLKLENPEGYKNVLLHMKAHMDELAKLMMPPAAPVGNENPEKPKGSASPLGDDSNAKPPTVN